MMVRKNHDPTLPPHMSTFPRRFKTFHHPLFFYSHTETHGFPQRVLNTGHVSYELWLCHVYTTCDLIVFPTDKTQRSRLHVNPSARYPVAHIVPHKNRSAPFTSVTLFFIQCQLPRSAHSITIASSPSAHTARPFALFQKRFALFHYIVAPPLIG